MTFVLSIMNNFIWLGDNLRLTKAFDPEDVNKYKKSILRQSNGTRACEVNHA